MSESYGISAVKAKREPSLSSSSSFHHTVGHTTKGLMAGFHPLVRWRGPIQRARRARKRTVKIISPEASLASQVAIRVGQLSELLT